MLCCLAMLFLVSCRPTPPVSVLPSDSVAASGLTKGWPQLYGPTQSNVSPEQGLALSKDMSLREKWQVQVGTGYSAPIVGEDRLVILSRYGEQEKIECRDAESGAMVWEHHYPTDFQCSFEYSSGPYATPVIHEGRVYSVGAQGQFFCIELENGNVVWEKNYVHEHQVDLKEWPVVSSPVVAKNGILIFCLGDVANQAGIIGVDRDTGKILWRATDHPHSHATPVLGTMHGKEWLFVMTDTGLVSVDPDDGAVQWVIAHRLRAEDRYNAASPVVNGNRVSIVTGPTIKPGFRSFVIQEDGSYEEPWKNIRLLNSQYTNFVPVQDHLFGFTPVKQGGPELVCLDLTRGKKSWSAKPGLGRGNLLAIEDKLLILGEDGNLALYELNLSNPIELWRTQEPILEKPCYTSMALSNGLLYARNEKKLVCYDLRQE